VILSNNNFHKPNKCLLLTFDINPDILKAGVLLFRETGREGPGALLLSAGGKAPFCFKGLGSGGGLPAGLPGGGATGRA
jgi:hypothetical protein